MDNGQANEVRQEGFASGESLKMSGEESLRSKSVDWAQEQKIISVKETVGQTIDTIQRHCPQCRESSLAVTKLEEAAMWATKAIANPQ